MSDFTITRDQARILIAKAVLSDINVLKYCLENNLITPDLTDTYIEIANDLQNVEAMAMLLELKRKQTGE